MTNIILKHTKNLGVIGVMWTIFILILCFAAHLILPENFRWLTQEQLNSLWDILQVIISIIGVALFIIFISQIEEYE